MVPLEDGTEENEVEVAETDGEVLVVEKVKPENAGSLVAGRIDITDCGAEGRGRTEGNRDNTGTVAWEDEVKEGRGC